MKKVISVLVLCLMLYNIMGYYIAYLALKSEAKMEMKLKKRRADFDEELTVIKLSLKNGDIDDKEFSFISEDEFIYKGEMYDMTGSEIKDGFIYFTCVNDKKEDSINLALSKHIEDNFDNSMQQKKMSAIVKNLIKQGIPQENSVQNLKIFESGNNYNQQEFYTARIIYDVSPPPPKLS